MQGQAFSFLILKLAISHVSHESAVEVQVKHFMLQIEQDDSKSKYPAVQGQELPILFLNLAESQVSHYSADSLHVKHLISHIEQEAVPISK